MHLAIDMKARCIKLMNVRGKAKEQSPWLTIGKVYHVLSVVLGSDHKWALRLVGDGHNGLALFSLDQFEIASQKIPGLWIATWNSKGAFELTPEAWNQPNFWEKYYDNDSDAIRIFEEEKRKIIEFDP